MPGREKHDEFRQFPNVLRPRGGYCVDCLSELYGNPRKEINGYIAKIGLLPRFGECANCYAQKDTFRDNPHV